MDDAIAAIIQHLQPIQGLTGFKLLTAEDKHHIQTLEGKNNYGVKECLQKDIVLIALHDETFRKPHMPEVVHNNGTVLFPAVPFPELKHHKAITGSPCSRIHFYLLERYYNNMHTNHATLLIGFNLTA